MDEDRQVFGCLFVVLSACLVILVAIAIVLHGQDLFSKEIKTDHRYTVNWCQSFSQSDPPICGKPK